MIQKRLLRNRCVLTMLVALFMVACTGPDKKQMSAEEVVKVRAEERWRALIDGRLETAYGYLAPEYRQVYSFKSFMGKVRGVGLWTNAAVDNVTCDTKRCLVTVTVYASINPGRGFGETKTSGQVKETWMLVNEDGQWYHLPDL